MTKSARPKLDGGSRFAHFRHGEGHAYDGIEHRKPGLNPECLVCEFETMLAVEREVITNLRRDLEDEKAMNGQVVETLRDLHRNWRSIIDDSDADGAPLIENILYWVIDDLGGHE